MHTKSLVLFIGLFFYGFWASAQNFNKDRIPRVHTAQVGLGPSFMYADNGGGLRNFNFKIRPAGALSYNRKVNDFMDVRVTGGFQMIESQSPDVFRDSVLISWAETGQAFGVKGTAYHLDIMPVFYLFRYDRHISRRDWNVYAGLGLGVMSLKKEEVRLINQMPDIRKKSTSQVYVPFRGGVSYRIGPHSDLALEGTFMATFADDIDGNEGFNRFNDHLFQAQVVFKRYLSPFPFWLKYIE